MEKPIIWHLNDNNHYIVLNDIKIIYNGVHIIQI